MRDMSHNIVGTEGIMPIYYKGENWLDGERDNGGVHTNSGVPNYWFYWLAEKEENINIAANIAYRTLTQYLTPTSNFSDARKASLQATTDIYGDDTFFDCFEYESVEKAWNKVGVFDFLIEIADQDTASHMGGGDFPDGVFLFFTGDGVQRRNHAVDAGEIDHLLDVSVVVLLTNKGKKTPVGLVLVALQDFQRSR